MKFKITSLVFVIAAIATFLLIQDHDVITYIFIALVIAYSGIVGFASYRFQWNFFFNARHHGKAGKLVITFDDGPHPQHTPAILNILKQHNTPAVFFVIGKHAEAHSDIVKQTFNAGHEIGSHSYSHSNFHGFFSAKRVTDEIGKANDLLKKITGHAVTLYRPPFGVTNPNIAEAVRTTGIHAIGWDIRSLDTTAKNEAELLQRITSQIPNGTILLLHDTQEITVKILPAVIDFCRKNDVEIISLKKALA